MAAMIVTQATLKETAMQQVTSTSVRNFEAAYAGDGTDAQIAGSNEQAERFAAPARVEERHANRDWALLKQIAA